MENTFKLGPIQEVWLKRLEEHPERQMKCQLGRKQPDGSYKACCLGEGVIVICEAEGIPVVWNELDELMDGKATHYPRESYSKLGLKDSTGEYIKEPIKIADTEYEKLAGANDGSATWPEIAAYIRANPENIFTKSV